MIGSIALLLASLADPAPIRDNSFLIEEAYNQESGVVQHITTFARFPDTDRWITTFTEEWPIGRAPRHQLSYTLSGFSGASDFTGGLGDSLLNWRYQVVNDERIAFAPRVSLLLPTGNWREDRGLGSVGGDFNLPVSLTTDHRLDFHWNAGVTIVPHAKDDAGIVASTWGARIGQGLIWRIRPHVDGMLEVLYARYQEIVGPDDTVWRTSAIVNPGLRWAHDTSHGLQIVPGVSFPIELEGDPLRRVGVLFYLSFEHPFGHL